MIKKLIPQKLKNYYHLLQAVYANVIFGFPSKKLRVIGVTGTNGKTTTVQMITRILEESGKKTAMASTINFKIAEREWVNDTKFTTLSSLAVQKFLKKAVKAGCEYAVLETSSHSLDQNRVWGIRYKTAVITNVTREHLDYHKNMDEYRIAKLKLFHRIKNAVVNLDMINARDYLDCSGGIKKFGFTTKPENEANRYDCGKIDIILAKEIDFGINYAKFRIKETDFNLKLPGLFNIENALAAVCVGLSENIALDVMKTALEKITGVPGRMEHVQNDRGIDIIVDYAVTPDSLKKLYALVSRIRERGERRGMEHEGKGRIISVFGSCGERDRGKRPVMGEIVSKNADFVIVTNEDPYGEYPVGIINEVFSGVVGRKISNSQFLIPNQISSQGDKISKKIPKVEGENCWRILDRREAIKFALKLAKFGDIVVVTGKGAEETMAIGDKRIPWNDKKVILEELSANSKQ